ncbi:periplasmic binding protein-like I [Obelidium mucronatum]|nr:periplasmic binding protein-like I [Obelidium mucronatum]
MSMQITLGFINNYCTIPNIALVSGALLANTSLEYDPVAIGLHGNAADAFYSDAIMSFAINVVNNSSQILPGITVNVKRFTDCGPFYPEADSEYYGNSGGFASSIMALDIVENHLDVIGVIGTEYSTTAKGPAEILSNNQIPYCTSATAAMRYSDKNKYPYFWRTLSIHNFGNQFYLLLKEWNVRQIGIVYANTELGRGGTHALLQSMRENNIAVVVKVQLSSDYSMTDIEYASRQIRGMKAQYVVILGDAFFTGMSLQSFSEAGMMSSERVWIVSTWPKYFNSLPEDCGFLEGVVLVEPFGNRLGYFEESEITAPFREKYPVVVDDYNMSGSLDCVMMMLLGFHRLLLKAGAEMLAERKLQNQMNFTLFQNLG